MSLLIGNKVPTLPSSINWADSFTVEFKARWNSLNRFSRIIDFGNGSSSNNIVLSNNDTLDILRLNVYNNSVGQGTDIISSPADLRMLHDYKIEYNNANAFVKVYRDNTLINTLNYSFVINNLERRKNYIGKSNFNNDKNFEGILCYLKITLVDGTTVLWYDVDNL